MPASGPGKLDKGNIETILPLGNGQAAMLVYAMDDKRLDPCLHQARFTVTGRIERDDFEAAWAQVIARHQALRLSVHTTPDARSLAVVAKSVSLPVDWRVFDNRRAADDALGDFLEADVREGLDLSVVPPMRLTAFQVSPDSTTFIWTYHDIALDPWSRSIVLEELFDIYVERRGGPAARLNHPVSVQDVLKWRRANPATDPSPLWSDYLHGAPDTCITSMMDRLNGPEWSHVERPMDAALAAALKAAAARNKVSPATLMTTIWGCMIAHALDQSEALISTNVSGRSLDAPGHDHAVGAFAEVQPRRVTVRGEWGAMLAAVQVDAANLQETSYLDHVSGADSPPPAFDTRFTLKSELVALEGKRFDADGGLVLGGFTPTLLSPLPLSAAASLDGAPAVAVTGMSGVSEADCDAVIEAYLALAAYLAGHPANARVDPAMVRRHIAPLTERLMAPSSDDARAAPDIFGLQGSRAKTPAELEIVKIWQEVLGKTDIDTDLEFGELGGKSITVLRMLAMVEDRFGVRVPLKDFVLNPTCAFLASALVAGGEPAAKWRMLVPIQPGGSRPPIHFIHHDGGHVLFLRGLAKHLGPEQPLYGYQPIGLDGTEPPLRRYEDILDVLLPELLSVQPEGPFFLAGHCAGSRLAHALATRLEKRGETVERLILLYARPPRTRSVLGIRNTAVALQFERLIAGHWIAIGKAAVRQGFRALRLLPEPWELRYGSAWRRRRIYNNRVVRAAIAADRAYLGDKIKAPIHMITFDETVGQELDWSALAEVTGTTRLSLPYHDVFFEPHVEELARTVSAVMAGAATDPAP